jgi:putative nucleotidyltransferase with HDIG domain
MRNNKKLILVVDDEEDIRKILSETLETLGFEYMVASDGAEAISCLKKHHAVIDVVICDLKMPKVAGDQVVIYGTNNHPLIPIIILTGFAQLDMALDHIRLGAFDYMTKPFRVKELQFLLKRALDMRQLQEEKIAYQNTLEIRIAEATQALHNQVVQTVSSFILAIEAKDRYTQGHSKRVAGYSVLMAKKLGLSQAEQDNLLYAAQLHDIGKIGISGQLLNKPGGLNRAEYEVIKTHPTTGVKILEPLKFLGHLLPTIESHHEWYDGNGYPYGRKRNEIPLLARIIAVCDSFDAMTSDRSYRKPIPPKLALQKIMEGSGKQFDPDIVATFLEIFTESIEPQMISQMAP